MFPSKMNGLRRFPRFKPGFTNLSNHIVRYTLDTYLKSTLFGNGIIFIIIYKEVVKDPFYKLLE